MNYLFTSESVSEGHPDKVADQISDAILDAYLSQDPDAKVACETFCTTDLVLVGGETSAIEGTKIDVESTIRRVIDHIGYNKPEYEFDAATCEIINRIHGQSVDINRGVTNAITGQKTKDSDDAQGAGDQGMMFGYACTDTEEYMPLALSLSHRMLEILADIRHNEPATMPYLRPDSKSQFTIEFSGKHQPLRVHTIVLSTQHDPFDDDDDAMRAKIEEDVRNIVIPRLIASLPEKTAKLFDDKFILHVNPTGKFVIGGPAGDTGLTGRKIIVDTYGGRGAHGGGAFSGKDPSKVDRSAAYAARYIAKNLVAAGVADECLVQVAYAIGVPEPVSVYVDTYGSAHVSAPASANISDKHGEATDAYIADMVKKLFDLRPAKIISKFGLKNPIFEATATYGHFGKKPYTKVMPLIRNGKKVEKELQFFGWELLDSVDRIKEAFGL
ncbi:MAG: methionine adenosyltransferase [Bacteroidales bacterium]|nr:methionine adenosyltransferase [Bacteroidales bacterium]